VGAALRRATEVKALANICSRANGSTANASLDPSPDCRGLNTRGLSTSRGVRHRQSPTEYLDRSVGDAFVDNHDRTRRADSASKCAAWIVASGVQ
jgi:hypothetical protein